MTWAISPVWPRHHTRDHGLVERATMTGNAITFGIGYLHGVASADGVSLRFALPAALTPCPPGAQVCIALAVLLTPGTYPV